VAGYLEKSDAAERHGFDKQMDVTLIMARRRKDKLEEEVVVAFWSRAEKGNRKGLSDASSLTNGHP